MDRTILHCDLNCFYASVELLSRPDLKDAPVAVCGDPGERHGIILAKNELAKRCGVTTAETIWQAKKKCPNLVLLPPHHDEYARYSLLVRAIYEQYTDLVEPFGIDESWLDITGSMHLFGGDAKTIADEIRTRVHAELGLTLSVGVSFNKTFAKLGSDYKKPDATTVISRENFKEIVFPLPVGDLLFVGAAVRKILAGYGVSTIGQLAACPREMLETLMGKAGGQLYEGANGLEREPVRAQEEPAKSIGNSSTFRSDLKTREEVRAGVFALADSVAMRLRREKLCANGVQITLRGADFKTITRQKQLPHSTHLMLELGNAALELVNAAWKAPAPIRMLAVTAIHLTDENERFSQLDLLDCAPKNEKQEKLERTMDSIRGRYGKSAIALGRKPKKED